MAPCSLAPTLNRRRESACKPDSVPGEPAPGGGHPSGTAVTGGLMRPTRASSAAGHSIGSYLALLREGFTKPALSPGPLVGSYPTFSPLPLPQMGGGRSPFLWHFPSGHPAWALPSSLPCGVRTFLRREQHARDHPAGSLHTPLYETGPSRETFRRGETECVGGHPGFPSALKRGGRTLKGESQALPQQGPAKAGRGSSSQWMTRSALHFI